MIVPEERAGRHVFRLQTRDGRARLAVDGVDAGWSSDPRELPVDYAVDLAPGPHAIRVLHAGGPISPVVLLALRDPLDDAFQEISPRLATIPRFTEPGELGSLTEPLDLLEPGLPAWRFDSREPVERDDVVKLSPNGVLRIEGTPSGYLATRRWFRDYELELEWRWPEGSTPGNSGVLVHVTTPLLFYGWPRSLEVQLQAGSAGDFWTIGDDVDVLVEEAATRRVTERPGDLHTHRRIRHRVGDLERPAGSWNQLRVRCVRDEVVVYVNGVETNRGIDSSLSEVRSRSSPREARSSSAPCGSRHWRRARSLRHR